MLSCAGLSPHVTTSEKFIPPACQQPCRHLVLLPYTCHKIYNMMKYISPSCSKQRQWPLGDNRQTTTGKHLWQHCFASFVWSAATPNVTQCRSHVRFNRACLCLLLLATCRMRCAASSIKLHLRPPLALANTNTAGRRVF